MITRKQQYEALERIFNAMSIGLAARERSGETLPAFSDYLAVVYDEWRGEVIQPLLTRREIEAYILRRLIAAPVPGFKAVSKHYLQAW